MTMDPRIYSYVKTEESYPDTGVIVNEGAHGDWIYVVLEGRVKVRKKTEKGMLTVATLKEGAVFGELVFLQNKRGQRSASVVAEGAVTVGILDANQLSSEMGKLSPMLRKLLAALADRLEAVSSNLVAIASQ